MDFYEEASLVMVPSGYKDQKVYSSVPDDGSADLTFSRASNATRVNSEGLVEKARTNLLLQSNQFDTTWATTNSTLTSGQTGYDGSSDAWKVDISAAAGKVQQSVSTSGVQAISVYAKAGSVNFMRISIDGGNGQYFNLSTGSLGTQLGTIIDANIESIGSGWYRCSVVANQAITAVPIYPAVADNDLTGTSGNIYIQDAQLETGDIATDYIETTTAAVSVGPVSGLPRLNYDAVNPTSASLLLEPQRTNLLGNSEDGTGTKWGNPYQVSTTSNQTTSPDGYANADSVADTAYSSPHRFEPSFNATSGTAYTFSYFAKANSLTQCHLYGFGDNSVFSGQLAIFDLSNGTIVSNTGGGTANIESYGSGWYRVSLTLTAGNTALGYWGFGPAKNGALSYLGDGSTLYIWGIQLEAGSYATSYIPTIGSSAVTRVADAASKTGISSLIGQTEGTIFLDFVYNGIQNLYANLINSERNTTNSFYIHLGLDGIVRAGIFANSVQRELTASGFVVGQRYKLAFAYKTGESAIYSNGVQKATSTATFAFTSSLDDIFLNDTTTYFGYQEDVSFKQALLFLTRLPNSDLETLTTF